jgi:hypothetical protein
LNIIGLANPTESEWDKYLSLFADDPNISKILGFLKIRNHLEVKRCKRFFGPTTTRTINSKFEREGFDVRIISDERTLDLPLEERIYHLYKVRSALDKTPA